MLKFVSNACIQNWRLSQDFITADDRVDQPSEEQEDSVYNRPQQGGPPLRVEVEQTQGHQGAHRHAGRKNKLYFTHMLFFHVQKIYIFLNISPLSQCCKWFLASSVDSFPSTDENIFQGIG